MKGNNTITLNEATMIAAVQHYFDTILFREGAAPKVQRVAVNSGNYSDQFCVTTCEPSQKDEPKK